MKAALSVIDTCRFAGCETDDVLKLTLVLTPPSVEQGDVEGDVALNKLKPKRPSVFVRTRRIL